jgi:hypothetical protein
MIRSWPRPVCSPSSADRIADSIIASIITARLSRGAVRAALASIRSVSRSWSREPQFTPIRTGLSLSIATRTIVWKCSSWRLAPTLPGLIRYFARAAAIPGCSTRSLWPL